MRGVQKRTVTGRGVEIRGKVNATLSPPHHPLTTLLPDNHSSHLSLAGFSLLISFLFPFRRNVMCQHVMSNYYVYFAFRKYHCTLLSTPNCNLSIANVSLLPETKKVSPRGRGRKTWRRERERIGRWRCLAVISLKASNFVRFSGSLPLIDV